MHDEDEDERRPRYEADPRDRPEPVAIPHTELSADALRGVIDNFILREGTDYGDRIVSHDEKAAQVLLQLERHEARILFDPLDSSVTIVPVGTFRRDRDTTRR
jgi:uncharacterized protein YheU (UPF0270 family)